MPAYSPRKSPPAKKSTPGRSSAAWFAAGTAALGLLVVVVAVTPWPPEFLARHWADSIESLDQASAVDAIERLPRSGDSGLPVLVIALGFQRAPLSDAALATLHAELNRWEELPPRDANDRLALLASALANESPRYGVQGRRAAGALIERILRWPFQPADESPDALLADAQRVLDVIVAAGDPPPRSLSEASTADGPRRPFWNDEVGLRFPSLPGGGLPIDLAALPDDSIVDVAILPGPDPPLVAADVGRPSSQLEMNVADLSSSAAPEWSLAEETPAWERQLPLEVMRGLHSAATESRATAHAELLRRGFSDLEIAVARRLTDAEADVRAGLAADLPSISGISPQPWLLILCQDEVADVRLAALSILATTSDAALLRRAEQIARGDRDTRIIELAERIRDQRAALQR
jgi:hypothetical protein